MDVEEIYLDDPEVLSQQEAAAELTADKPAVDKAEVNSTALYVGALVLVIVCSLFAVMKTILRHSTFFDYPAMIFLVLSGVGIYKFHREEKIGFLLGALALLAGAFCLTLLFFLNR